MIEEYLETGFNYRMTDIQAAIGLVQLGRLDAIVAPAPGAGRPLPGSSLGDVPGLRMVDRPAVRAPTNYQSFWVLLPDELPVARNDLLALLAGAGISARRGIMASHLEPAYAGLDHAPLPVTERLTQRSLILPLYHELRDEDQVRVASALLDAAGARRP